MTEPTPEASLDPFDPSPPETKEQAMAIAARAIADRDAIDMDFRPRIEEWKAVEQVDGLIGRVPGKFRRALIRRAAELGRLDELPEELLQEQAPPGFRQALMALHPGLSGGEWLPPLAEDEVVIVDVSFEGSVLSDRLEIRARPARTPRDEEEDEDGEPEEEVVRIASRLDIGLPDLDEEEDDEDSSLSTAELELMARERYARGVPNGRVLVYFADEHEMQGIDEGSEFDDLPTLRELIDMIPFSDFESGTGGDGGPLDQLAFVSISSEHYPGLPTWYALGKLAQHYEQLADGLPSAAELAEERAKKSADES